MRILAVVGSSRRGNTYAMVEAACYALADFDVELVHLKDVAVEFCDGCLTCDDTGECHVQDGMANLVISAAEADGFVFGTPARWGLLSGELKTFLDRLNPLAAPEKLAGKLAIVFAVGQCEGDEAQSITSAADSVIAFCADAGIQVIDSVVAEGCLEQDSLIREHPEILEKCKSAAERLSDCLLSNG